MKNELEHIDSLFKESLTNQQVTPPTHVWTGVQSSITAKSAGVFASKMLLAGKWIGAIIVSSGLGLGAYYLVNSKSEEVAVPSKINNPTIAKENNNLTVDHNIPANTNTVEKTTKPVSESKKEPRLNINEVSAGSSVANAITDASSNNPANTAQHSNTSNAGNPPTGILENNTPDAKPQPKTDNSTNVDANPSPNVIAKKGLLVSSLPNVFTPNNDGINDYFFIEWKEVPSYFDLFIYENRTNKIIFKTTDPNFKWDGKFNNLPVQEGTYIVRYLFGTEKPTNNKPYNTLSLTIQKD